jgi:hypothetical protein
VEHGLDAGLFRVRVNARVEERLFDLGIRKGLAIKQRDEPGRVTNRDAGGVEVGESRRWP